MKQPIRLTPTEARILARCSLHYHFRQQSGPPPANPLAEAVREAIQQLHAAGGPARLSLPDCLRRVDQVAARPLVERYYHRLAQDWPRMMASNESLELKIAIGGVSVILHGTIDRLDQTGDGGLLAILFHSEDGPPPTETELREDPASVVYHALAAAAYPDRRPVRIQELWLEPNETITIELSEEEYRRSLADLRQPVRSLARDEVMARPGWHCDSCPFQYRGCPVYSRQPGPDDFSSPPTHGKIPRRKWIFKI